MVRQVSHRKQWPPLNLGAAYRRIITGRATLHQVRQDVERANRILDRMGIDKDAPPEDLDFFVVDRET